MTVSRACARAPVRVDPAGGGTDAPPFVTEHGGSVVNFGVERYAYAAVERLRAGEGVTIYAFDLERGVTTDSSDQLPDDDPLEFVKAFVRRLVPPGESTIQCTVNNESKSPTSIIPAFAANPAPSPVNG